MPSLSERLSSARPALSRAGRVADWAALALVGGVLLWPGRAGDGALGTTFMSNSAAIPRSFTGFEIRRIEVEGHNQVSVAAVTQALNFPANGAMSSLEFDAAQARERVKALPWVKDASIALDPAGVLRVRVSERTAFAVWQGPSGPTLIDEGGAVITRLSGLAERRDLPLLMGEGANEAVASARAIIFALSPPQLRSVAALEWVGERRWNVRLTNGLIIKLPTTDPLPTLKGFFDSDLQHETATSAVAGFDLRWRETILILEPGGRETHRELLSTWRSDRQ